MQFHWFHLDRIDFQLECMSISTVTFTFVARFVQKDHRIHFDNAMCVCRRKSGEKKKSIGLHCRRYTASIQNIGNEIQMHERRHYKKIDYIECARNCVTFWNDMCTKNGISVNFSLKTGHYNVSLLHFSFHLLQQHLIVFVQQFCSVHLICLHFSSTPFTAEKKRPIY